MWIRLGGLGVACALLLGGCDRCDSPGSSEAAQLDVQVAWPGVGAADVERAVAIPLERALASVPGLRRTRVTIDEGVAALALDVDDPEAARAAARLALAQVDLPSDAEAPLLRIDAPEPSWFEVWPAGRPPEGRLDASPRFGAPEPRVVVEVLASRATAMGVSMEEIEAALGRTDVAAGQIEVSGAELRIRSSARPSTLEELGDRIIRPGLRVEDVADLRYEPGDGVWARTSEGRAIVATRPASPGAGLSLRAWGAIPRVRGPGAIVLVDVLGPDEAVERAVGSLLDVPSTSGARVVALRGDSVWGSRAGATEVLVLGEDARDVAVAIERAAHDRPGIQAAAFTAGDRWVRLTVQAASAEQVERGADGLDRWLAERPDVTATWSAPPRARDSLDVELRRDEAARLGVTGAAIARAIRLASDGVVVGRLLEGADALDVVLRSPGDGEGPAALEGLRVRGADGALVPLSQVASIRPRRLRALLRVDGRPAAERYARVEGDGLEDALGRLSLPAGVTVALDAAP